VTAVFEKGKMRRAYCPNHDLVALRRLACEPRFERRFGPLYLGFDATHQHWGCLYVSLRRYGVVGRLFAL
jgi:hypothetical protein